MWLKRVKISSDKKGFTLIELLVTITILGIITILALPGINRLQAQNKETKYEAYGKSMLSSAKLYIDSYTKDVFGNNTSGCYDIPYKEMVEASLLKKNTSGGVTCDSDKTFIRVYKSNDNYRYESSLYCSKGGKKVYEKNNLNFSTCENKADKEGPTISISPNGVSSYVKSSDITISIKDAYGLLENVEIKYGFATSSNGTPSSLTTKKFTNKRGVIEVNQKVKTPNNVSGDYYLVIIPVKVRDVFGNWTSDKLFSKVYKLDNTKPTLPSATVRYDSSTGTVRGNSSAWTNRTLWWGSFSGSDAHSGIDHYEYSTGCTGSSSGTLNSTSGHTYSGNTNTTFCIRSVDKSGNMSDWSSAYYFKVDKSAPGVPSSTIRYDSSGGTVRENSSAWTNRTLWWGNYIATDAGGSGVNRYEYSTGCTGSSSGTLSTSGHTYSADTNTTFCIRAVDNAGNIGNWSGTYYFKVDKTKPVLNYRLVNDVTGGSYQSDTWSRNGIYRYFTPTDSTSGVSEVQYNSGGGWNKEGNVASYWFGQGNSSAQYRVLDNAGNYSDPITLAFKIDWEPPRIGWGCQKNPPDNLQARTKISAYITDNVSGYNCFDAWWSSGSAYLCRGGLPAGGEGFYIPYTTGTARFNSLCDVAGNCTSGSYSC